MGSHNDNDTHTVKTNNLIQIELQRNVSKDAL